MKVNSTWIYYADKALKEIGIVIKKTESSNQEEINKGKKDLQSEYIFPTEFKGYISAFAATIVQTGLYPALLIYEQTDSNSSNKRYLLPRAILYMLAQNEILSEPLSNKKAISWQYNLITNPIRRKEIEHYIEKAIIALKMTIRMYKPVKNLKLDDSHLKALDKEGEIIEKLVSKNKNRESNYTKSNISSREVSSANEGKQEPNIGWLYYRDYYNNYSLDKETQEAVFKDEKNKKLFASSLSKRVEENLEIKKILNDNKYQSLTLKTTNPGLIIGIGLSHGTSMRNDLKCGFQFDYTIGLPYIPGSSVKGILRSMFPSVDKNKKGSEYNKERVNYLNSNLGKNFKLSENQAILLTRYLFDHDVDKNRPSDIFMDALITGGPIGNKKPFMSNDFLAPHSSPYKEPNPIEFIKILPNVQFTFFFKLSDIKVNISEIKSSMTISQKQLLELFKQILLDVGAGAKTNVGYGQLAEINCDN